jgi:cytochrome P450
VFSGLVIDMLCTATFGVDYHTLEDPNGEGRQLMNDLNTGLTEFAKNFYNPLLCYMFWRKSQIEAKAWALRICRFQQRLLDNYRVTNTLEKTEKGVSIMDHLLRAPYKSHREKCADMTAFLSAEYETTAYSCAWSVIEVAQQPHIYQKIKAEIDSVVANDVEHMTHQHLSKLVYLDHVIKESMRLNPVAAGGSIREASKDVKYENIDIPKGSNIMMPQYVLFRMDIQDPELFNPDRWN